MFEEVVWSFFVVWVVVWSGMVGLRVDIIILGIGGWRVMGWGD